MSDNIGSNGKPRSPSTHGRDRSDRRWWRYNGALAPRDARVRGAERRRDAQLGR
jgi:hypothetical protein